MIVTGDGGHFTAVSINTSKVKPGTFKMQFSQKNRSWISEQVMEGVPEEFSTKFKQTTRKKERKQGNLESRKPWPQQGGEEDTDNHGFYAPCGQRL